MKVFRQSILLILVLVCTQCDYWPYQKKKELVPLDTIVDFSSVDTPPTFSACEDLMEKAQKEACFRATLSKKFSQELSRKTYAKDLVVESDLDETVTLTIAISREGEMRLKTIQMSEKISQEIPEITSVFKRVVAKLPKLYPAIKRGIPVGTEYTLPVRIKL